MRVIQQVLIAMLTLTLGRACLVKLMELASEAQVVLVLVVEFDALHLRKLTNTLDARLNLLLVLRLLLGLDVSHVFILVIFPSILDATL